LYGYQKNSTDYSIPPQSCNINNTIYQNITGPTIYQNQTVYSNQTITETVNVPATFFEKYGIAIVIVLIAGGIIIYSRRKK
jgi:hypothetical protein